MSREGVFLGNAIKLSFLNDSYNLLDKNWINWKFIDGRLIGKRCVSSKGGFRVCWLEDVPDGETIHKWLCGKHADYNEVFIMTEDEFINRDE